jgi:hypothetical protein
MASPLALVGIGASAVGGVTSAIGNMMSGQAQANMYNYQAGVAQANAEVKKQDAAYALEAGEVTAQQSGMRTRAEVGATKVGFAAGNVAGASTDRVLTSETEIGAENQALIRANAAKRAYGFEVGASADIAQAGADRVAASTSKTAGDIGAVSSLVGAAGQVSSKWLQYKQYFPGMDG